MHEHINGTLITNYCKTFVKIDALCIIRLNTILYHFHQFVNLVFYVLIYVFFLSFDCL